MIQFIEVKNYDFERQLTEHFKLGELIKSNTAYSQKILMQYVHQENIVDNLMFLCVALLEPIRRELNAPLIVSSGYRCSALNMAVGGAKNSLHLQGLAADICSYGRIKDIATIAREMRHHEVIVHPGYVHVSIKSLWSENRYVNKTGDKSLD